MQISPTSAPFGPDGPFWLGEHLLREGRISSQQLESAKRAYRQNTKAGFAAILENLGMVTPQVIAEQTARRHGLKVTKLQTIDPAVARLLPEAKARNLCVLPFAKDGDRICVAVTDPLVYPRQHSDADLRQPVSLSIAPRQEIIAAIDQVWKVARAIQNPSDFFSELLRKGISYQASDLHLEPGVRNINVRYRIDGQLVHHDYYPKSEHEAVVRAIKNDSGMDAAETRLNQDGVCTKKFGASDYTFRISTVSAIYGESVVVRLQSDSQSVRTLAELGLDEADIQRVRELLKLNDGLIIATGPTGSGKSTALNSWMQELNHAEEKTLTVEDPVEFADPRFVQMNIVESIGKTFDVCLRSAVRHDPDNILVGEVRDHETASTAIRAAMTGHLVFTTLHTNTAPGAISRLINLGIEPFYIASSVRAIFASRLLPLLCPHCKVVEPNADILMPQYGLKNPPYTHRDGGCPACNHRGYKGRIGAFEIHVLYEREISDEIRERNNEIQRIITLFGHPTERCTEKDLMKVMLGRGLRTLRQHALSQVDRGLTSLQALIKI